MLINPHALCPAEAVECGLAPIPQFGGIIYDRQVTGNTTYYGTRATYMCLPPYVLFGGANAECTSNGNWTKTPECRGKKTEKTDNRTVVAVRFFVFFFVRGH